MRFINITRRQLEKEYGIYVRKDKLTRNRKFLTWLPVSIELTDDGFIIAIDGWNRITYLT